MGDVSYSCSDFGYAKILRNYFETSHARGPQDAAGRSGILAVGRRGVPAAGTAAQRGSADEDGKSSP